MNVHLGLQEVHIRTAQVSRERQSRSCTRRMHVHSRVRAMNVHLVLHLHGISGTI
jgi:hypothetical protein